MKSSSKQDEYIRIGKIIAAHGIRGAVKVYSYATSAQSFTEQKDLLLVDPSGCEQTFELSWAKPYKNSLRVELTGITTRTQAESLIGCSIWIPKKSLPPLEEDTYYWFDLIGMSVYGPENEYLGKITQIIETGANDVYSVETPQGYPVKEILLPAIASVVIDVDIAAKRMEVVLPEGLI